MTHLDEGQILALRDDAAVVDAILRAHVEECAACRQALDASRSRGHSVSEALGALDEASWNLADARERVRLRVADESARAAGAPSLTRRRGKMAAWSLSRAAGLLLVTAAGLSALPGSPVRAWLGDLVSRPTAADATGGDGPTATVAPASALEEAGVRLPVREGPLAVILRDAAPGTEIRVRWIPGAEAAVFAPVGSRFTSGEGRMEARLVEGGVRVELPRSVTPVSLEVNGRIVLRSTGAGLEVNGPTVERSDEGITFRIEGP